MLRRVGWIFGWLVFALGCNGQTRDATTATHPIGQDDAGDSDDAGAARPDAPCSGLKNGTSCGDGRVCIAEHCLWNSCGDGFLGSDEACDDGNAALGDGCNPNCHIEPSTCGDTKQDASEECDDGNKINDDACSNTCTHNECGNARIELREECDDGNEIDDDACSKKCTTNVCGNARMDAGETCDDGNKNDNDGCTNACVAARCGDGVKTGVEECDDGNEIDDDDCATACKLNACGNLRIDPGETCDGDSVGVICKDQCKTTDDVCRPCEDDACRDFEGTGVDLVAGCYENAEPSFVQRCVDAITCARAQNCAYTGRGAEACYCGAAASAQCQQGMGINGVCKTAFEAAAGSSDPLFITSHFGDRTLPIGNAVFMLQCDTESCADVCLPLAQAD